MIGYILTEGQKDQIQGQHFAAYECFNCVQDINNVWFTFFSDQQKQEIASTEWSWILDLPQGDYTPKQSPPFPFEQ